MDIRSRELGLWVRVMELVMVVVTDLRIRVPKLLLLSRLVLFSLLINWVMLLHLPRRGPRLVLLFLELESTTSRDRSESGQPLLPREVNHLRMRAPLLKHQGEGS
jgi:hypothetical protein